MPEQASAQERTEEATPYRRREARKQGTVARSHELTNSIVLLVLLLALPTILTILGSGFIRGLRQGWRAIPLDLTSGSMLRNFSSVFAPSVGGLIMVVAIALIIGVATTTAQVGFVVSSEALKFNFSRLNPISGFKRLVSPAPLFEALKAVLKTVIFGLLAYSVITANWGAMMSLGRLGPAQSTWVIIDIVHSLATKLVFVWLGLAGVDYFFQRKRIDKQLMMTKQEVKQEMKQNEQSAEIKGHIARQRRRLSRSRMAQAMKKADVVVTNPTHYAVAIEYDAAKSTAPIVVAKGADLLAARIREMAAENNVPIVPNPPLARALYRQCEIGDPIPRDLFQPVAEVLAYVYRTLKKVRKK
jgi:flagellar biosynthetic protein FlhB